MKADVNLELLFPSGLEILSKHISLLKAVDETKSITKAAQMLGISYKNAWDSLDIINNKSDKPLIIRTDGNKKNSGSGLSEYGKKMVQIYDTLLGAQRDFLAKICKEVDLVEADVINLSRLKPSLSARNQLNCEIVKIKEGAVNSQITGKLQSGELLNATITLHSQKELDLKEGMRAVFIFKAPAVMLASSDDKFALSTQNQLIGEAISVKIGAVSAEVVLSLGAGQTISSVISKESVMSLKIGVGDRLKAIVEPNNIIIGV